MHIYKSNYPSVPLTDESIVDFLLALPLSRSRRSSVDSVTKETKTRGQVFDEALSLARGLILRKQAKPGQVALILGKTSVDYPVVALGCMAAGLIPSLASAACSPPELLYQLQDCKASFVFVDPELLPVVLEAYKILHKSSTPPATPFSDDKYALQHTILSRRQSASLRALEAAQGASMGAEGGAVPSDTSFASYVDLLVPAHKATKSVVVPVPLGPEGSQQTAVLCYSSGTTGLPKGVELTHRNLTSVLKQFKLSMPKCDGEDDSTPAFLPMYHIYGFVKLVLAPLHQGYSVIVLPKFSVKPFCQLVEKYKCTFALVAPPVLIAVSKSPETDHHDLSSLRWFMTGAAPCGEDLTLEVERKFAKYGTVVVQGYGSTETAPASCILDTNFAKSHRGCVGALVPNMEARLVNDDEKDVPVGSSGELWVRGPNIMKGYLGKPDATKNALTSDGWYKTGDVCTIDEHGIFKIVDRKKELIKVKGFQVAPAELEGILLGHPEIADIGIVGVWEDSLATELPRAYIVPAAGMATLESEKAKHLLVEEINLWLKPKVAHYKQLIGGTAFVEELPRLPSGKILRRTLRDIAKAERAPVRAKL
ncbi:hypothetical protein QFC21_000345 [Naganishia friedmannii]|uniref:Uncharacterized protein n=1 Tax=Naganishia friedmannii TaxID=89922 RepID=A0ACC2WCW2_9TREE|nr:hypothetical protein QFC21_000345 [Naganishia friedmannii]